ncbi:hypothetical protein [Georgenia yuyongxinii]
MGLTEWVLLAVVVLGVLGWSLWVQASRVDRLHRTVLRSRATLEAQLFRRATAAAELAGSGVLDPAESVIVADVALRATDATSDVLVPDGLEGPPDPLGEDDGPAGPAAGTAAGSAKGAARVAVAPDRGLLESELSRTLRAVLGTSTERAELAEDPHAADVLGQCSTPGTACRWPGASTTRTSNRCARPGPAGRSGRSAWPAGPRCPSRSTWTTRCRASDPPIG